MSFVSSALFAFLLNLALSTAEDRLTLSPYEKIHVKFVGDSFFVSCTAKGRNVQRVMWTGPENKQITDYQSSPVQQSDRKRIHVDAGTSGQPGVDLYNLGVEMKDSGDYTCSANVDGKEVEQSFKLMVYKIADFIGTPQIQFLEEGNNSTLQCIASGDPPPKVTWFKNNVVIKTKKQNRFKVHPDNKDWLILYNVSLEDAGNYTCRTLQLDDKISEMKKFQIEVNVNHKPFSPMNQASESFSFINGVVNLSCEAIAKPKAKFTWIRDGIAINVSDIYEIFDESHKSVLQINVDDEQKFGDYNCRAQNILGTFERVVTLEKGKQPAKPHTKIKKREEKQFTLKIHSENQPEMPTIAYYVEYKLAGEDWQNAIKQKFKSGKPYILTGLKPDTLYVIRASAQNVAGLSDPSAEIFGRTLKLVSSDANPISIEFPVMFLITLTTIFAKSVFN